jgi:DNA-binding transcriptional MerR regulator/effector-binding domain-containing protein
MFKIGDFSRIARVSCRLLRYYDELGLLRPAIVDRSSGYRFYSAAQLQQLNRILVLRELGLSLDQIAKAVSKTVSADELRAMLLIRRADVEQALAAETDRLRQIETRISQIDTEGRLSVDDVLIRLEPARYVLTRRQTVQSFAEGRGAIQALAQSLPRQLPRSGLGPLIAIAHSGEFEPDSIDLEYGFAVSDAADRAGLAANAVGLQLRELPAVQHMAVCVRIGLPEHAHLITAKIGQFVESNGYALAGPSREVFLQPLQPDRMEQSVVEMQYPVESLS